MGSPEPATTSTALLTDHYELTMLGSALTDGTHARPCVFEVFARRLPDGRRYGVVAGTARVLDAGRRYGIPTRGTVAHAFMLLHDSEEAAFRAQVEKMGADTTLLVDTYDITAGIETAVRVAGPELGAIRIDSGDVGPLSRRSREQLDSLGAKDTQNNDTNNHDEHTNTTQHAEPVDAY